MILRLPLFCSTPHGSMWPVYFAAAARSPTMFLLDAALAQSIVERAMQILHTNVSALAQEKLEPPP